MFGLDTQYFALKQTNDGGSFQSIGGRDRKPGSDIQNGQPNNYDDDDEERRNASYSNESTRSIVHPWVVYARS